MWSFLNTTAGITRTGSACCTCVRLSLKGDPSCWETTARGYWVLSWYHNGTKSTTSRRRSLENKWDHLSISETIWLNPSLEKWRQWGLKRLSDLSKMTKQVRGRGRTKTQSLTLRPGLKPWTIMVCFREEPSHLILWWWENMLQSHTSLARRGHQVIFKCL